MTTNRSNANHDERPGQTPGELGIQAAQAAAREAAARFRGCVHEEANADIGHNSAGERVVRIGLTYTRGTAPTSTTLVLALDTAITLRNRLDGLFAAAGIDDGDDDEDVDDDSLGTCTACGRNDCICDD